MSGCPPSFLQPRAEHAAQPATATVPAPPDQPSQGPLTRARPAKLYAGRNLELTAFINPWQDF